MVQCGVKYVYLYSISIVTSMARTLESSCFGFDLFSFIWKPFVGYLVMPSC